MQKQLFNQKSRILSLMLLLALCLLGTRDLLLPGFYESHDGVIHLERLAHLYPILGKTFPVRWIATWMAGYGSPIFNFNWQLPYYIAAAIHRFGWDYQSSVKAVLFLGFLGSGVFAFMLFKKLFNNDWAALAGAVLYTWAPYRFIDIYIRGAIGEATAFIFLPLTLLLVAAFRQNQKQYYLWILALSWSGLILTHNVIAVFFSILVYAGFVILNSGRQFKKRLLPVILATALGVGLAAYYWLPAAVEMKTITYSSQYVNLDGEYLPLPALFKTNWQYEFAVPNQLNRSMSFQIGWVHWLIIATSVLYLGYAYFKKQKPGYLLWFFLSVCIASLFLTTRYSSWVYLLIKPLQVVAFPWRLLSFTVLAISGLGAFLINQFPERFKQAAGLAVVFLVIIFYLPYAKIVSGRFFDTDDKYFDPAPTIDLEFLPVNANYPEALTKYGLGNPDFPWVTNKIQVYPIKTDSLKLNYTVKAITKTKNLLTVKIFNFPGWTAYVNNKQTDIITEENGLIQIPIQAGENEVQLRFIDTPIRKVANGISVAALLILAGLIMMRICKLKPAG